MTKIPFNLTLAKFYIELIESDKDITDNFHYNRWKNSFSSYKWICDYFNVESISALKEQIKKEEIRRKKMKSKKQSRITDLEKYVSSREIYTNNVGFLQKISSTLFSEMKSHCIHKSWTWSQFKLSFDYRNSIVMIESWTTGYDHNLYNSREDIFRTEILMSKSALACYKSFLEREADRKAEQEFYEEEMLKRQAEIYRFKENRLNG